MQNDGVLEEAQAVQWQLLVKLVAFLMVVEDEVLFNEVSDSEVEGS